MPANSAARERVSRAATTASASAAVSPSVTSSAFAIEPVLVRGGAQQPAGRGGRQPDDVGDEQLLDERFAGGLVGHEPAQREHVRARRRLGGEREPALGHRARDARVVERPQQAAEVRALATHDDRHVVPRHAVLDVQAPELARDRGVLLARVRRDPGLDGDRLGRAMVRGELDVRGAGEDLGEPVERHPARALEREDVRGRVRRPRRGRGRRSPRRIASAAIVVSW